MGVWMVWVLVWMETVVVGAKLVPTWFLMNICACNEVSSIVWVEMETLGRASVFSTIWWHPFVLKH